MNPLPAATGQTYGNIAVVHLAVRDYGIDVFQSFVASYRLYPPGCDHELIIAAKQFGDASAFEPWADVLKGVRYRLLLLPDRGLDIGSYFEVAFRTDFSRYFFCNSRTTFVVRDWLRHLVVAQGKNPGGVVGATGSWQSISSEHSRNLSRESKWVGPLKKLRALIGFLPLWHEYPRFPNPHLRTNAFLIERTRLLALDVPTIGGKQDAMRFESGRRSLTRQMRASGKVVQVVDREGRAFEPEDWRGTNTFWQGDQSDLLVADNQTIKYAAASQEVREELNRVAWKHV